MLKRTSIFVAVLAITGMGDFAVLEAYGAAGTQGPVWPAAAHEQTLTFAVENMTCALCPITVRKAMAAVPGVRSVQVDLAARTATVLFDPTTASAAQIAAASAKAGYPAKQAQQRQQPATLPGSGDGG